MWHDMLTIGVPLAEKVIRTVAVYGAIAILLRLAGKRDLAELNSFDFVVMLLLSNVVQNAVIGPDDSLLGGLVGAVVLLAANAVLVRAVARVPRLDRLFEGGPVRLAEHGRYDEARLQRLGLRRSDVDLAIRRQGADDVAETESVMLEPGGAVLARRRPEARNATRGDLAEIADRLDRIERRLQECRHHGDGPSAR